MDWKTRIPVLFLWIFVVLSSIGEGNAEQRVVCYYTNWSVYRPGTAKFSPQNINPYLCTHLIYAFGGFTKDNTLKPFDKYQDIEKGGYAKFTGLKTYNKDLKTMLAIGGWNEGSSRFSPMVADAGKRKEFVKNSVKFLRQNHFDGLDLDWEYPAFRDGGKPRDRNNYADLVQELREEFEKESSKTGRSRLLLSMAMPAGIEYIDKGYDVPRLNEYLDFINLLSYDYHSAYEPAANHHSPLYPLEEDNEYNYDSELTIDYTINHLLKNGASTEKIVLGIPTYGRSYTLFNEDATDIGAPADGPGEEGDATREKGYLAYYEICESIAKSDDWQVVQPNPSAMGPYAYRGNQWVGYDDEDIVRAKARYVNEKKLGGIMFWSIDNDDFRGKCHGRPYPLIEAAKEALLEEKSDSVTKTRNGDDRKKTRNQGGQRIQTNTISRKFKTGRRSTTTESTSTRRRISSTRNYRRSNSRINSRDNEDEKESDDDNEEEANSLKSVEKPRSKLRPKITRSRNQSAPGSRKNQQNSRRNSEDNNEDESREKQRSKKITTPEPPTTPDPGTDFKCEDEGFFPHPRDCKKYFWCLDSGPSGLGIVGHQFTCPSGLVFNKAADSCDYPRNVVCPKTKVTQSAVTTTRAPITAATSRTTYLHKPTQRTTTAKSESDEEYDYYDVEDDEDDEGAQDSREIEEEIRSTTKAYKTISRSRPTTTASVPSTTEASTVAYSTRSHKTTTERVTSYEDEEDPRVLKELIDLIKKAGGIEQLEKQLLYQEKNSAGNVETAEENGKSTPATISRSLYERVLNRQATRIAGGFLGSFSTTQSSKGDTADKSASKNSRIGFVNGPGGAQFEGLDLVPEVKNLRRTNKHQYVTIERNRHSTSESPTDDEEESVEEDEGDSRDVASSEDRAVSNPSEKKPSNRRFTPSYVNIRRPRPSATKSENDVDLKDEGEENADDPEEEDDVSEEKEEPIVPSHRIVKTEEKSSSPKSRYTNTQRFRSTTLRNSVNKGTEQVKNDSTTSPTTSSTTTTTTTTTTEETIAPVTEKISEISTMSSTTLESLSSSMESLINLNSENMTRAYESSSKETSSTLNPEDTTKASNEVTLALVENSATEILFTTVPAASSLSTGSSYDTFTRGPSSPIVSQPRPFGFSRRGRPTTTTASPTTSVTEQTRPKVDSESPKLPTLKELVGLTANLSYHESTSESTRSPTTSRVDDTTIAVDTLRDETNDRGYKSNQVDIHDHAEGAKNLSDSNNPMLKSAIDKEFLDNDILSSDEIQRRSSSASFVNVADNQINRLTNDAEQLTSMDDDRVRRVEVPVKILDDTNGEEIAELVLLRVPENKFNSAKFNKPILRVKILERENDEDREGVKKRRVVKLNKLPDSSLENELPDNLRTTTNKRRKINAATFDDAIEESSGAPSTNRPRNRQRIVKARRRTRPSTALNGIEENSNVPTTETTSVPSPTISSTSGRPENTEKSVAETKTMAPEFLENVSTTVPRATTLRGNSSILLKFFNATRGFYVTRNIDEVSLVPDYLSTNFVESSRYSSVRSNDAIDDTTHEIDLITLKMDSINTTDTTTSKINTITQSDETIRPGEETMYTIREEIATRESTSVTGSLFSSLKDKKFTSDNLETLTPVYTSTMKDQFDESTGSWTTLTEGNVVNKSEVTTLGSWSTEQATTTNPTISIESPTTEISSDDNLEIDDNHTVTKITAMTEHVTESSKTSENIDGRPLTIMESKGTINPPSTVSAPDDAKSGSPRLRFDVASTTESIKMASYQDYIETTSKPRRTEVTRTTVPMTTTFNMDDETTASQTEKSLQRTTNPDVKATIHREVSNRGGIRYTTSAKSTQPIDSSSRSGDHLQITTRSYEAEVPWNDVTGEKVSPAPSTSLTDFNDETIKSTVSDESTRINSDFENRNTSPYTSSKPFAKSRKNARKTTKNPETNKTKSKTLDKNEGSTTIVTTTERYVNVAETTVSEESPYLTANIRQETVDHAENSPLSIKDRYDTLATTSSFNSQKIGSVNPPKQNFTLVSPSSTESYVETAKSTASVEATYFTTNFEGKAAKRFENSLSPSKDYDWTQETTESPESEGRNNKSDGYTLPATSPITTEAYEPTSPSEDVIFTTDHFEDSDQPHLRSPSTRSQEDHETQMNASTHEPFSLTTETTEPNEKIIEQTTTSPPDLTYSVEFTGSSSASAQNVDPNLGVTRSFENSVRTRNFKTTKEYSATTSTAMEIYEETMNTMDAQIDYPTTYSIQKNNNGLYGTTISDKTDTFSTTAESDDKMTVTIDSVNTFVTNEVTISEENRTESSDIEETTTKFDISSVPWVYHRNLMIDHRETPTLNETTDIESPIYASTASYDERITDIDEIYTKSNDQTMPELSRGFTKTTSSETKKNDLPTEPNKIVSTSLPNTISEKSLNTRRTGPPDGKIDSSAKEFLSKNDAIPDGRRSTTVSHEESTYSAEDSSMNYDTPVTERQPKRTRGKVRFIKLAGSSNDSNEQTRRPFKQVVVRRRLANKDRNRKPATPQSIVAKSLSSVIDRNQNPNDVEMKNPRANHQNLDDKTLNDKDEKNESRTNDVTRLDNTLDDRSSEEKSNLQKSTRRRVIVYRGRPRAEKTTETPKSTTTTTKTSTTTVQSPSYTGDDITENTKSRRRKWRKRIVLKRSRINIEEDDQSIAETGDVSRVLIDDEHVKDFRNDELAGSYIGVLHENEKSSKREDFGGEVNLFKNSGPFLRRPGNLARNDASNRSRSKVFNISVPTTTSTSRVSPLSSIQSVDPTYETKTHDQSVRAQELAVTLSDPPAFDSSTATGRVGLRKQAGTTRKISTTIAPRAEATTTPRTVPIVRRRQNKPMRNDKSRNLEIPTRPRRPAIIDYDYYVDDEIRLVLKPELKDKLFVTQKGGIRCLDQGNFAHPTSCKKFITCARMVNGQVIGTEYTCPDKLSFDPVGGICNWSAGLGCEEKSKSST